MFGMQRLAGTAVSFALATFGLGALVAAPTPPVHADQAVIAAAPADPDELAAFAADRDPIKIGLRWNDNSIDETGFEVEKRIRGRGEYVRIATVPANDTQFVDADINRGVQYQYRVRAVNGDDASGYTNSVTAFFGEPGKFRVDPDLLDFGRVKVGEGRNRRFRVKNTGRVAIAIKVVIDAEKGPFSITENGGEMNLAPGASRQVTVHYSPKSAGKDTGKVSVSYGNALLKVRLRARAVAGR